MSIELKGNTYYSKVFKRVNYKLQNSTFLVVITTVIYLTIDGRHGILGARHIAEALHIPYEPVSLADYRE